MEKTEVILMELKNYEEQCNKILRQLVIERIKNTSSNKFKMEEIEYWSQYFEILILIFMFQVLQIKREDYIKLLKKQKRQLESEVYIIEKTKYQRKKVRYIKEIEI